VSRPSAAEVELLEADVWAAMHGRFADTTGHGIAAIRRWGRAATLAMRDIPAVSVNRAIGFGFDRPLDPALFSEIQAFYRDIGKARWFMDCSPVASIDSALLEQAGGRLGGRVIKLVGDLDSDVVFPSPTVEVVSATKDDASEFMAIVGAQLGIAEPARAGIIAPIDLPGWTYYLALHDGKVVAGAALCVSGVGSWLGFAGTLPDYRARGAQTSLLTRRLQDARRAGCLWTSAETWPETVERNPSLHNMKRLGLYELYQRPWMRFDEQPSRPSA
jgi:GNAT superfamily N-acetyltransferase